MPDSVPRVTKEDIIAALRDDLGVEEGDVVFPHSSLRSFGYVEGGAEAVCCALIEVVGDRGTVVAPAFSFGLIDKPNAVFRLAKTPCCVGAIPEHFRKHFATSRSRHLTHSVCACGEMAGWICEGSDPTPFGLESGMMRMVRAGAKILLFGVTFNSVTLFHCAEQAVNVPYLGMVPRGDVSVEDWDGSVHPLPTFIHKPTLRYDFMPMEPILAEKGLMKETRIGACCARLFDAQAALAAAIEVLQDDPFALTRKEES